MDRIKIIGTDTYTISKEIDLDVYKHRDKILDDRYTKKDVSMINDIIDNEICYLGKEYANKHNSVCGNWQIKELDYKCTNDLKKIPIREDE
tara:strand:- start:178 stop:450 length:273 start_codon:yes stop_codon:yes gene_type:complete